MTRITEPTARFSAHGDESCVQRWDDAMVYLSSTQRRNYMTNAQLSAYDFIILPLICGFVCVGGRTEEYKWLNHVS